jgi:hypothetical protein
MLEELDESRSADMIAGTVDFPMSAISSGPRDKEHALSAGDAMIEAIAAAVAAKLEGMLGTSQRLMDIEEAAKYLGMTPHALRHKTTVDIPCVRIDAKLRFDRRDLDRYIDRAKREGV